MQSDTHIAAAVAIQSGLLFVTGIENQDLVVGSMAIAAGGALVPDFDHAGAYISNRIPLLGLIGRLFQHRGLSHTLFFWLIVAVGLYTGYEVGVKRDLIPSYSFAYPAITIFIIGGLSHVLMDSMTPTGVPWFGPFSWNRYSFDLFKTGSLWEWLFKIILYGLVALALSGLGIIDVFKFLRS